MSNYYEILFTLWRAVSEGRMELKTMVAKPQAVLETLAPRL